MKARGEYSSPVYGQASLAGIVSAAIWLQLEKAMSKWQYDKAGDFVPRGIQKSIPDNIKSIWIKSVAHAFITNQFRTHAIWKLKPDLVEHACVITEAVDRVFYELTGHLDFAKGIREDPQIINKINDRLENQVRQKLDASPNENPYNVVFNSKRGIDRLEELIDFFPPGWHEGFAATLAAMLTNAWTSFEVLATDLWEAAINAHPRSLSELKGVKNRIARKSGAEGRDKQEARLDETDKSEKPDVLNTIREVTRGTMNAGDVMGTVLRNRFAFHKLSGIRQAYSCAFSKRFDKIDTILADTTIDRLNLIRNLILHEAGTVEKGSKFIRMARDIGWQPTYEIGKPFPLNGLLVSGLIRPVFDRSAQLILA